MPMLRCPSNYLVVLIASLVGLSSAQRTITTSVNDSPTTVYIPYLIEPTGVQDVRGSFGDSIPLQCTTTCYAQETIYGGCFLDYKVPIYNGTATTSDTNLTAANFTLFDYSTELCTDALCGEIEYQVFAQCMNCIVANGGEGPRSAVDYGSLSLYALDRGAAAEERIDAQRAQGWLRNVTEFCTRQGREVLGVKSVTATATATGPYTTTWQRSGTVAIPSWTEYTGLGPFISSIEADILSGYLFVVTASEGQPPPTRTPTATAITASSDRARSGAASRSSGSSSSSSSTAAASSSVANAACRGKVGLAGGAMGMVGIVVTIVTLWA